MTTPVYLTPSQLPPRPDRTTGEPRPPQAPRFGGTETHAHGRDQLTDPAKAPAAPAGQGPVLAWYKSSRRGALRIASWGLLVLLPIGMTLLQGFSLEWMKLWQVWGVLIATSVLMYFSHRATECSVGADWLRRRRDWVKLYELTKVTAHIRSNVIHLDFRDRDGRAVQLSSRDVQQSREMWDLVYNGILHSVIAGDADTNGRLHAAFSIPRRDSRQHN